MTVNALSIPNLHRGLMAGILATALVLVAPHAHWTPQNAVALPSAVTASIPAQPVPRPDELPFTMRDVLVFLSRNFEIAAVEAGSKDALFIYAEPGGEEIMQIAVSARESQLRIVFTFREMNVMHYVAEFIESPLFTMAESEQLYALLYAPNGPRWQQMSRFQACAGFTELGEAVEVAFEFAPIEPRG